MVRFGAREGDGRRRRQAETGKPVPQLAQYFAPGLPWAPQAGQNLPLGGARLAPHSAQNFPSGTVASQLEQVTVALVGRGGACCGWA